MMSKRKLIWIGIAAVLVIAAVAAAVWGYHSYQVYHATYLRIDEVDYRRDSESLDLSGHPVQELEKVKELTNLKQLDLRGTGMTTAQYEEIQAALPGCSITWSVPFQNRSLDNTLKILSLDTLCEADIAMLKYFPRLTRINAGLCRDYGALFSLMAQRPDLDVSYSITLSGQNYYNNTQALVVRNPIVGEILENLPYLPNVRRVSLTGKLPGNETIALLIDAFPEITFTWDFMIAGVRVNTEDTFIDLSGVTLPDTQALEDALPYLPHLTQVDMVDCGIPNEEMDALNQRYENIKFVWAVTVSGKKLRTDTTYFMPAKYHLGIGRDLSNLKYCKDIEVLDFGHYHIGNVDFVQYLPNLKYLLLCEASLTDLTAIGNCSQLEYLELFMAPTVDLWPLANLTNLRDLNLTRVPWDREEEDVKPFGDITPLLQMTWLDRLWVAHCDLTGAQSSALRSALCNTVIVFESKGCTTSGFRYTPRYYQQRDILGMYYSHN